MIRVPTVVRASAIDGLGLFAAEPIAKGTLVWSFTPGFDLETDVSALDGFPAPMREWLLHYGYIDKRINKFVLCCDDARFLNHSPLPNLVHDSSDGGHGVDIAARDIEIGEELTVDYGVFEAGSLPDGA